MHRAPLPQLVGFVQAVPTAAAAAAGAGADGGSAPKKDEHGQVGLEQLPESSPAAVAALAALALPDLGAPRDAPLMLRRPPGSKRPPKSPMEKAHATLHQAAAAPLPDAELDWASVLTWTAFPLRAFPCLVLHVLRRHPALQPPALADAAILANKPEYAEVAALDSRHELLRLLGMPAVEPTPAPAQSAAPPAEQATPPPSPSAHEDRSADFLGVHVHPS